MYKNIKAQHLINHLLALRQVGHESIDERDFVYIAWLLENGQQDKAENMALDLDTDPRDYVMAVISA